MNNRIFYIYIIIVYLITLFSVLGNTLLQVFWSVLTLLYAGVLIESLRKPKKKASFIVIIATTIILLITLNRINNTYQIINL